MSSVVNLFDRIFTLTIAHSNSQSFSSTYTLFQTAFVHLESTNPHVAQYAHKIQAVFNTADIGWTFLGIKAVVNAFEKKYNITIFKQLTENWNKWDYLNFTAGTGGIAAGLCLTAFIASKFLNQHFQPYENPNELLDLKLRNDAAGNISITFERPLSQLLAQQLFVARIVLNIALTCLSSNRALPITSLLGQTYSLIKLSQLKWLNFSRLFQFVPTLSPPRISSAKISYHALLTPFVQTKGVECGICLEENPTSYFCSYHPLHDACLVRNIYTKSKTFANSSSYLRCDKLNQFGRVTSSSYNVSINQENLPECPHRCNERYPEHGYFEVLVNDVDKGKIEADVSLQNQIFEPMPALPRFFETVNLIYNLFQTGLAYIQQRHHELISRTLNTQRALLIADILALGRDYSQLYSHIKTKVEKEKKEKTKKQTDTEASGIHKDKKPQTENSGRKIKTHFVVATVASSLFAAMGIWLINRYLKPSVDLKGLLKTATNLSPKEFDSVNICWDTPLIHKMGQFLALNRISVNLLSAFALSSRKSLFHILTASLQTLTLYKISQLPWIKFEKTLTRPDAPLWSSSGDQRFIDKLTVGSHFLPPADETPSALKPIYDYTTNFFNGARSWSRYWYVTTQNGGETSRTLTYDVTVQPSKLLGDTPPYINRVTAWALDRTYGSAVVKLFTSVVPE